MTKPQDGDELWLWWDSETSGLLEDQPVILEAGWMLTTPDLRQLTPLCHRYVLLDTRDDGPPAYTHPLWPAHRMDDWVTGMHRETGLEADWIIARDAGTAITSVSALDDLVAEDVATAREYAGHCPVRLAGAGVSHFDLPLLRTIGSQIPGWCEYGPADTSCAARVARLPKITVPDPQDGLQIIAGSSKAPVVPHRVIADIRASWATARSIQAAVHALDVVSEPVAPTALPE